MRRRDYSKFYILGGLLAAIVLLIFLNSIGWLEAPKNIIYTILSPVLHLFQFTGDKISGSVKLISDIKNLAKENSRLTQENQQLVLKVAQLGQISSENDFLRAQLQLRPQPKSKMVIADIIGFDPANFGQYFFINKGANDGISMNQAVSYAGGFLVGKIVDLKKDTSKVLVLTDSNSSIFSLTADTRINGVVKGDHGVGLILDMVPPEKEIKEGEIVVSSGLDGQIPKGLVIGQVTSKISVESEVFQRFEIKPAINYKEIERVFVILGNE